MIGNKWIFWIIIGATVLQWVFGKFREQAEMNRAKQDREKQRIDSLRTGQGLTTGASTASRPTPTISQHDLQSRRQAQLKALRDRQRALGQAGASQVPAPSGPTMGPAPRTSPAPPSRTLTQSSGFPSTSSRPLPQQRPLPVPQTARQTTVAAQRAARAKQIRINRQRQLQQQQLPQQQQLQLPPPQQLQRQQLQQQAQAQPSQRQSSVESRIGKPKTSRIDKPKHSSLSAPKQSRISQRSSLEPYAIGLTTASKAHASQAGSSLRPVSRQDWRRAIVASEILAPPISMREID